MSDWFICLLILFNTVLFLVGFFWLDRKITDLDEMVVDILRPALDIMKKDYYERNMKENKEEKCQHDWDTKYVDIYPGYKETYCLKCNARPS